jgi:CelD/BcsL family acetyltransferase involved in cellulose biosynthesis
MHIQLIRDSNAFATLRTEWNELLSRSSADTVFLTWEWLSSWWETYAQPDDRLHIITVRDNANQLIGVMPLFRRVHPWLPLKPVRTLHFIGDGSADSDYLDSILVQGREEQILTLVWDWLCSHRSSWDVLQLSGIPETSVTCSWLTHVAEQKEVISRNEKIPCLVTDLGPSWEDYLSSLRPRFRTKIRSTLREIETNHRVRFYTIGTDMDLGRGLRTLYELHEKRWRSTGASHRCF